MSREDEIRYLQRDVAVAVGDDRAAAVYTALMTGARHICSPNRTVRPPTLGVEWNLVGTVIEMLYPLLDDAETLVIRAVHAIRPARALAIMDYIAENAEDATIRRHVFMPPYEDFNAEQAAADAEPIRRTNAAHRAGLDAPMGTYRIDQLALDLADVLAVMKVSGPCTLAGHSMGGMVALAYLGLSVEQRPVDVQSLVLVATAAGKLTERGLGKLLACPMVQTAYKLVGHLPTTLLDKLVRRASAPLCKLVLHYVRMAGDTSAARTAMAAGTINATALRTKVGFLPALREFDVYDVLPRITARTTILSAGQDAFTPKEHAHDMYATIPDARHLHHPTAGHMLLGDTPGLVTSVLSRNVALTLELQTSYPNRVRKPEMIGVPA